MRKIMVILITLIILIVGLSSGCTEDKTPTIQDTLDKKNIMGVWANVTFSDNLSGFNQSTMLVYNFTDSQFNYTAYYLIGINSSYKRYFSTMEGMYEIANGNLILTNETKDPPLHYRYQYSFTSNNTTLTLTNSSGFFLVFSKL